MKIRMVTLYFQVLVIAIIGGCASTSEPGRPHPLQKHIDQARKLRDDGDYKAAARIYLKVAQKTSPPASDRYRFFAVESLYQAGELNSALEQRDLITPTNLSEVQHYQLSLLYGRIYLAENQPEQTLRQLEDLPVDQLSPDFRLDYHTQRAKAFARLGNHFESAKEQILAEELLSDPEPIRESQSNILKELGALSVVGLKQLQSPRKDTMDGWIALTLVLKQARPGTQAFDQLIQEWKSDYPGHPANIEALQSGLVLGTGPSTTPAAIGVLLPLSGPYTQAGEAIRQGILIAQRYDSAPPVPIRFYNSDLADPEHLYRQAVNEGAEILIGPLDKEMLKSLATRNQISIPTLGLNQVPELDVANLYQFGLNPEDEVEQAADSAWFDGYHRALIFAPATSNGQRLADFFARKWQEFGGEISGSVSYDPENTDRYDEAIQQLLQNVDNVTSDPTGNSAGIDSGDHGDFVFLIALPPHARLIKPMFQYYMAGNLAVYGTSQLYSGSPSPTEDQDLSGIMFCDIPWLFNYPIEGTPTLETVLESWPHSATSYVRLMALGFDSYNLLPYLGTLESNPEQSFAGVTGTLSMTATGRIHRHLVCAEFQNGVPVPRGPSPRPNRHMQETSPMDAWNE